MLPFDDARCKPVILDVWCSNCKRWADHPKQTWGERTPQFSALSPHSESCRYIPIKENSDMR